MRRGAATLAAVGLVIGLAGCAAPAGDPGEPGGPTTASDPVGPHPLLDVDCAGLIDEETFAAAYREPLPDVSPRVEGYGGMGNLAAAALKLAGATRCAWSDGAGAAEGSSDRYLDVDVLPSAGEEWAALEEDLRVFQPKEGDWGEKSWWTCRTGSEMVACQADVLAGGHWIAVRTYGLVDADSIGLILTPIVDAFASAGQSAPDWAPPTPITADCASLLPLDAVQAAIGDDVDVWQDRGAVLSQTLRQAALDRAGALHCAWRNGFGSATARTADLTVLPGGDLVWDGHFSAPVPDHVERAPLDGVGDAGYSATHRSVFAETERVDGVASVLVGSAWLTVWANDEGRDDDRAIAEALAAEAASKLGS